MRSQRSSTFYLPAIVLALLVVVGLVRIDRAELLSVWPWPRTSPPSSPQAPAGAVIADGVTIWGQDVAGRQADQLLRWLTEVAPRLAREPVPAVLDPGTRGVIPDLAGAKLDIDGTIAALLTAPPATAVEPVFIFTPAAERLADFPLAPLYRGNPQRPQVTFLINVAWGNDELAAMLDVLDAAAVRASFFLVGRWAEKYPGLAGKVAERGHEIANHGYSDAISIGAVGYNEARADLERAHQIIKAATDQAPNYFSPHRGELSPQLLQAAADLGYRLIMWTVDTIDWQDPDRATLLNRVLSRVEPGAMILMHPRQVTVEALPELIVALRDRQLEPVPLKTLLDPELPPQLPSE